MAGSQENNLASRKVAILKMSKKFEFKILSQSDLNRMMKWRDERLKLIKGRKRINISYSRGPSVQKPEWLRLLEKFKEIDILCSYAYRRKDPNRPGPKGIPSWVTEKVRQSIRLLDDAFEIHSKKRKRMK